MLSLSSASLSFAGSAVLAPSRAASPSMMAKSKALPFLEAPAYLDGSMTGDVVSTPNSPGSTPLLLAALPDDAAHMAAATSRQLTQSSRQLQPGRPERPRPLPVDLYCPEACT
jgi:hypothetical protein